MGEPLWHSELAPSWQRCNSMRLSVWLRLPREQSCQKRIGMTCRLLPQSTRD